MRVPFGIFVAVTLGLAGTGVAEQHGQQRPATQLESVRSDEAPPTPPAPELCAALEEVDRETVRDAASQQAYDYLSLRCLAPGPRVPPRSSAGDSATRADPAPPRSQTALERCNKGGFLSTGSYFFATQAEQDACEALYERRKTALVDLEALRGTLEETQPALAVRIDEIIDTAANDPSAANDLLRRLLGGAPPPR
ncbi:hypothetical protein [Sagittula stellata]|uniref:Uncharacterized protein n=1 Tax=Sagittula stellata (strain ATCC 700073 / DSM 11524 / E-37) TaxID=388399 RepID=A3K002_SAGS3|nr:hypothetical protein [Sagittula stellata]EBA09117.1 hypothetical protein SSE37_22784 [Sagittula stellata E-37]